jgi:hypothetical protein
MIAGAREMSMIRGNRLFIVDARASADTIRRSLKCENCGRSLPLVTFVGMWHPPLMEHLGPHRTILDPHDTRGIGGVVKSTPIPRREKPLEGTKDMLCPKDPTFLESIVHTSTDTAPPHRSAMIFGILAVLCGVTLLVLPWMTDASGGLLRRIGYFRLFVCLTGVHLFGIFSYIVSKGRTNLGGWAIIGLYLGVFVDLILLHWFQ